ncbi:MAG: ribosomal-processing cysteine protease Prp [Oscillospiraceae bacterium]|nr:ribosomal-processing cysteine protease Prp [Oscillospiraceae bacterium]
MTTITFHTEGNRVVGFDAMGHSGFAAEGEDIVCAAVTSTVRLVECVLNDVMGLCAAVKVDEETTKISLRLPGSLGPTAENTCQNLLTGMMLYLSQLHSEYPEYVEVMEAE